jgi:hypothetical protein
MVRLSSPGCAARAFAVAACFALAACGDNAATPTASLEQVSALEHRNGWGNGHGHDGDRGNRRHLRRGRYRDRGHGRHDRGRSGNAELAARAVLGADGITRLRVTTGDLDDPSNAPGDISKLQVKVYGPDGRHITTLNYQRPSGRGTVDLEIPGLPAGSRLQVMGHVGCMERNRPRTYVVTVNTTVLSGPSLTTALHLPPRIVAGVPAVITATVSETRGQLGASTRCVLYVDGRAVDASDDVWVDAGDQVTCAFTHTFATGGAHDVRVSLEGGDLAGDGGPALPPSSSDVADVVDLTPGWTASVLDRAVTVTDRYDLRWRNPNGSHKEYEQSNSESPREQTIAVSGTLARATGFPLASVRLQLRSGATSIQSATWTELTPAAPDVQGQSCLSETVPEQGSHFTLCSTGSGYSGRTTFSYTRFAGTVTYHSRGFSRTWDAVAGSESYWTWNENPTTHAGGGQLHDLSGSVRLDLAVADGLGAWTVAAVVGLTPIDNLLSEIPYTCRDESPYWLEGGVQTICEGRTERETGWRGTAAG